MTLLSFAPCQRLSRWVTFHSLLLLFIGRGAAAPLFETITVFGVTPDNRPNYRIPALAVALNGDLLLFAEKRHEGIGDLGNHDLVMVRSVDQGRNWGAEQVIFDDGDQPTADPTVCIDRERGRIFLFCLQAKLNFAYFTSDDHGKSWVGPRSIHSAVTRPEWAPDYPNRYKDSGRRPKNPYGVGPGHSAIQLTQGAHRGRLLVPARHVEELEGGGLASFSHVFYSDDHGESWRLGSTVAQYGNECRLEELPDGTVMMSMRNVTPEDRLDNSRRLVALSRDGGDTWTTVYRDDALVSTPVHAALRGYPTNQAAGERPLLLFANPASAVRQTVHPYGRYNLTVRWSHDNGNTWSAGRVIYPHPSSYSDMDVLPDGSIVLIYERGPENSVHYWDELQFVRFNRDWLFSPPHTKLR